MLRSVQRMFVKQARRDLTISTKQDVETLMNEGIDLAKRMLASDGEFYPYGAAMTADGEVLSVAIEGDEDYPASKDVLLDLINHMQRQASIGEYKATAIFYNATMRRNEEDSETDVIAVALDHKDAYSVVVYHPFELTGDDVVYGTLSASRGRNEIFQRSLH